MQFAQFLGMELLRYSATRCRWCPAFLLLVLFSLGAKGGRVGTKNFFSTLFHIAVKRRSSRMLLFLFRRKQLLASCFFIALGPGPLQAPHFLLVVC